MNQTSSPQHTDIAITVASWEERFRKGMERLIEAIKPSKVLMFHFKEYAEWSNDNRKYISDLCREKSVQIEGDIPLSFDSPLYSWKNLLKHIEMAIVSGELITLDISTMPREAIWSIFHVLTQRQASIQYIYNKPEKYADWLSRDPGRPRLLYRLAGIQHLGRPTALVVQTGYDVERVKQLVRFYEPDKLLLGLQTGEQFDNAMQNRAKHESAFEKHRNVEMFDVDGYSLDIIQDNFMQVTKPLLVDHNVILSSLGPKVGALSLFTVKLMLPDVAMSYAPSNEYNREYSSGIGESIHGILKCGSRMRGDRSSVSSHLDETIKLA